MTVYVVATRADWNAIAGSLTSADEVQFNSTLGIIDMTGVILPNTRDHKWRPYRAAGASPNFFGMPSGDNTHPAYFNRQDGIYGPVLFTPGPNKVDVQGLDLHMMPNLFPENVTDAWLPIWQALFPSLGLTNLNYMVAVPIFGQWSGNHLGEVIFRHNRIRSGIYDDVRDLRPWIDGMYPEIMPSDTGERVEKAPAALMIRCSNITVEYNHIENAVGRGAIIINAGDNMVGHSSVKIHVRRNIIERHACDAIQIGGWAPSNPNAVDIRVEQNFARDAVTYAPNPDLHVDFIQFIWNGSPVTGPIRGVGRVKVQRNMHMHTVNPALLNATWGASQCSKIDCFYNGYLLGSRWVENIFGMGYMLVNGGALTGGYIRGNIALSPADYANVAQPAYIDTFKAPWNPPGQNGVFDNIVEGSISGDNVTGNNLILTKGSSAEQAAALTGGGTSAHGLSPHQFFEWVRPKSAHASKGFTAIDVRDFLLSDLDFTGERVFCQAPSVVNAPLTTQIHALAFIHGGDDGDLLDFVPPPGCQWGVYDIDVRLGTIGAADFGKATSALSGTVVQAISGAASGTIPAGKVLVLRKTTTAISGDFELLNYSVGGQTFTWQVANVSAQKLPRANIPAFTGWTKAGKVQVGGQDIVSETGTMIMGIRWSLLDGVSRQYYDNGAALGGPDCSGFGAAVAMEFQNAAGAKVASANVSTAGVFQTGRDYVIAFSFDMRADGDGVRPATYADGAYYGVSDNGGAMVKRTSPTSTIWTPANLPVNWSNAIPTLLKRYANNDSTPTGADIMLIAATPEFIPLAQYEAILTAYSVENWGPAGEGLSPTETPFPVWFVGRADRMDAGTANRGTGGAFTKVNAQAISQALDMPWPPSLVLKSALAAGSQVVAGQPIVFDFFCNGYNDAFNLTTVATGVAGAWTGGATQPVAKGAMAPLLGRKVQRTFVPSETGTLTVNASADHASVYAAPAPVVVEVAEAAVEVLKTIQFLVRPGQGLPGVPLLTSIDIVAPA
jgi:hypothetical protein